MSWYITKPTLLQPLYIQTRPALYLFQMFEFTDRNTVVTDLFN